MDKCIHSGLISIQMSQHICLYDKSKVYRHYDDAYEGYAEFQTEWGRILPISSVLGLPSNSARINYSCFNPTDANLMFAGCNQGQLHLFDLSECSRNSF